MGEIGIQRIEYLYSLTMCDLMMIERGYYRRSCNLWSSTRWSTYYLMSAFVGGDKLAEKGIHSPKDLISLPWDNDMQPIVSETDVEVMLAEMAAINEMNGKPQP